MPDSRDLECILARHDRPVHPALVDAKKGSQSECLDCLPFCTCPKEEEKASIYQDKVWQGNDTLNLILI